MRTSGLCGTHYLRWKNTGDPGPVTLLRKADGEGHLNDRGYVEMQRKGIKRLEHIWVMEEALGRPLDTDIEEVHHKNGIRNDNRLENLELMPVGHGSGQHFEDVIPYVVDHCSGLIELYRRDGNTDAFPTWAKKA